MKKKLLVSVMNLTVLIAVIGPSVMFPWIADEADVIIRKMTELGFLDNKIDQQRNGSYAIRVNSYTQKTQALSLKGIFLPFDVRARLGREVLYLEKADIEKAGFSVNEEYLPPGIKIARMAVTTLSRHAPKIVKDPSIERIERALEETERNKTRVYANARAVAVKANQTFLAAFPDVCKSPAPSGPIPIPYPNISKSSDTAKGSKKVKIADKAVAIKKASEYKKSESDEAGTQMTKLQSAYRRITARRELTAGEKAHFEKELQTCLDKVRLLAKTLDKYVDEIERLLKQAKQ